MVWVQYIGKRQVLTPHAANSATKHNANFFIYPGKSIFFPVYTGMCNLAMCNFSMCFLLILLLFFLSHRVSSIHAARTCKL